MSAHWLHLALYQPEIPPNTGNIMRLCANTGAALHLIHPCGFSLDDKRLRRAGLDYRDRAELSEHRDWAAFLAWSAGRTLLAGTTRGRAAHSDWAFRGGEVLLLGPETRGLPDHILDLVGPDRQLRLPMRPDSRSLNLSNAAAVFVYEAWRQLDYA